MLAEIDPHGCAKRIYYGMSQEIPKWELSGNQLGGISLHSQALAAACASLDLSKYQLPEVLSLEMGHILEESGHFREFIE